MRVLVVENDPLMSATVIRILEYQGFKTFTTGLGEEAVDLAKMYDYDVILLDLILPDMNGLDVLGKIRQAKIKTPVIILSATADMENKLRLLYAGADDYVAKPFHDQELIARIHVIVRRCKGHPQSVIRSGDLEVNLYSKAVTVNGVRVHLTGKEYGIIELLSLRKGTTLTKVMFLNHLYDGRNEPDLKIIDVFISTLRKKLAKVSPYNYIETVWGRGYALKDPKEAEEEAEEPVI